MQGNLVVVEKGRRPPSTQDLFALRHITSVRLAQLLYEVHRVHVSKWTVRRKLQDAGLSSRRPAMGLELLPPIKLHSLPTNI